jgi:hypothetical protein
MGTVRACMHVESKVYYMQMHTRKANRTFILLILRLIKHLQYQLHAVYPFIFDENK